MRQKLAIIFASVVCLGLVGGAAARFYFGRPVLEKIFAISADGSSYIIADPQSGRVFHTTDVAVRDEGSIQRYEPYAVTMSPDQRVAWIIANAGTRISDRGLIDPAHQENASDQIMVVGTSDGVLRERMNIGPKVGLRGLAFLPSGTEALVSLSDLDTIDRIHAEAPHERKEIHLEPGSKPGAIVVTSDGTRAYVAETGKNTIAILDLRTETVTGTLGAHGRIAELALTPDGRNLLATIFDEKQLMIFSLSDGTSRTLRLPETSAGPWGITVTSDSNLAYVADQGYDAGANIGSYIYLFEISSGRILNDIKVGDAPRAVLISKDGRIVYTVNSQSGDISAVGVKAERELKRVEIAKGIYDAVLISPR